MRGGRGEGGGRGDGERIRVMRHKSSGHES